VLIIYFNFGAETGGLTVVQRYGLVVQMVDRYGAEIPAGKNKNNKNRMQYQ